MCNWSKSKKPQKRKVKEKVPCTKWDISSKKSDGSLKRKTPSPTAQSPRPNVSTYFGSSNASPAKRHKWNGHSHVRRWSSHRKGKHSWGKERKKSRHPNPSPQAQKTRVQHHMVQNQDTPRQDSQPISGLDVTSCRWLWYGAYIGNETRNTEFKQGTGYYMENVFISDIRKYGCAFLNSGGGTLLVGVHDNGMVCGVYIDHEREDATRLQVDSTAQQFHPPLLPHNYSLRFLPVVMPGVKGNHLRLVCLTFTAPPGFNQPTLYHVDHGQVYIRRDASVQGPVGAPVIIEWFRQMWAEKVQQLEQSVHEMMQERCFLTGQVQMLLQIIASQDSGRKISASGRRRRKEKEDQKSNSTSQNFPSTSWNSGYQASSPDQSSGSGSGSCSDSST